MGNLTESPASNALDLWLASRASVLLSLRQQNKVFRMSKMNLGDYLLTRLKEAGIGHLIGVPGDFNLSFLEQVQDFPDLEWVGTCNELNAAYAADCYARLNGSAALIVTYGVGDLSALNGIAGAYAEHLPLIVVSGAPPLSAIRNRELLHHTAGTGAYEDVMTCMAQFTAAQARLTPANAVFEIDRLVQTALREKLPVYMQLPSDICWLEVDAPATPFVAQSYSGDTKQTETVVNKILSRLQLAKRPAILVDADAQRFGLGERVCALGEKAGIPFASLCTGRSIFNEHHPLYRGIYGGQASAPDTLDAVEGSDCLIAVGVRLFDLSTGYFTHRISTPHTIQINAYNATIDGQDYEGITAAEILQALCERLPAHPAVNSLPKPEVAHPVADWPRAESALTHVRMWPRLACFLKEGDLILAENGTPMSGISGIRLPADTTFLSQNVWASIGYTLPALIGAMLAQPKHRHLLFIGDGSLQMTAQEISTILRLGLKPIIFVLNNRGYTIERVILGPHSVYNDVQNWRYAELPQAMADGQSVLSLSARKEAELDEALAKAEQADCFTLIELQLDSLDAPLGLLRMGPRVADYDYGERGPQERVNAGLRNF